jgi:hypothetical protein
MAKYMILYNSDVRSSDRMSESTPEEMEAGMQSWLKWRDEASKDFKVDFGLPLQAVSRITTEGVTDSNIPVSGYSLVEGDSMDKLLELLQTHPHLNMVPGASIDVLEMLPMPGLDA